MTAEHNRALVENVLGGDFEMAVRADSFTIDEVYRCMDVARAEGPQPTRVEENETLRDCAGHGCLILYDEGFTVQASAINRLLSLGVPE